MPEQDPRQGTPRPRPGGTASTGQMAVARTRETASGPTGTARIPILRQPQPGPADPRPGVRQPESTAARPATPVRSRLRTPPAAPRTPAGPPAAPPVPGAFESIRPASRPTPVQAFPVAEPLALPVPVEFAPEASTVTRRHPGRGVVSMLAVVALMVLYGLPAFAGEALSAPPVAGIDTDGVQRFQVGSDVDAGDLSADSATGSLPVAAAPAWLSPLTGRINDGFGPRTQQPVPGVSLFHRGQDITAACGTPLRAAHSGVVKAATYWGTYGNWILIDGGDGVAVGYAHESRLAVTAGQRVRAGQIIGFVGDSGAATGCHTHVEVHVDGVAIDPVPFFAAKQVRLGS